MSLVWRTRIVAAAALLIAVWLGFEVAEGSYVLPVIFAALALLAVVTYFATASLPAVALGLVLFGYIVGNRGFAQLMIIPGVPLLPAEFALLVAGGWMVVECALVRRMPFRRDALNLLILLWLIAGSFRVYFDAQVHGLLAVRDFAMVYYAAFFFLAQQVAGNAVSRRFLLWVLVAAALVQPLAAVLSETFQDFFFRWLSVRGVPLILFKGDLAFTFTAVSAFLLALALPPRHRLWVWAIASVELLFVISGANRASMVGALVALSWLAFSNARRFVLLQFGVLAAAALLIAGLASVGQNAWAEQKVASVTERARSLTDFFGVGTYVSDESSMKGDNNRFRVVWWRAVIGETLDENPLFGLGFGHDLARNFLQEYNPEGVEDFTARSPHSILISTFGRMGAMGLLIFLLLCAALVRRTWRVMRNPDSDPATMGFWAAIWVILVSACFGVVLEGPMAAVVFWSLLGLANAPSPDTAGESPASAAAVSGEASAPPSLQQTSARPEVAAT